MALKNSCRLTTTLPEKTFQKRISLDIHLLIIINYIFPKTVFVSIAHKSIYSITNNIQDYRVRNCACVCVCVRVQSPSEDKYV